MLLPAAVTLVCCLLLAPATGLEPGLDLLEALQLHNSSRQGVSPAPGPQHLRPAYYLQGDFRDLRLPPAAFQRVVDLLRHNAEFTLAASLRQEEANAGTILAFSHGYSRYLELQSSGRKDEIRLHYTSQHDAVVHVETFPFRLADNAWHKLAVSVSGAQVELLIDCHMLYRRLIRPPDRNFSAPQLALWVGQRNAKHSFFKGSLDDVRIIMGPHGYLKQCPLLDSSCPTCGQFSLLQSTVEQLTQHLQELTQRLLAAEDRITQVESCDCFKSCRINGSIRADGASWKQDCNICSCVHGEVQCRPIQCPPINCKNPVYKPGECCPSCLKQCFLRGNMYDHGESVSFKQCVECTCQNGFMPCKRIDPETMCPPLTCSPKEQFSVPEECCKFCPGVDYCSKGHMCHENATCLNLQTTYACQCNNGYFGDGHLCRDVDECLQAGGLEGHHCHSNTRCVNTPGSYICECLPGYRRLDKFNCVELDECSSGEHGCHANAACVNTLGSYHCQCHEGYVGDGYQCKPICNQTCLNGGECVAPGQCQCRRGYMGSSCELDLDECTSDVHNCHESSQCVNMPGWYYCRCRPGFRSLPNHYSALGAICQDIDECNEGIHSCHPTSHCVNTEGGFQCSCDMDDSHECRLSCMFEGSEIDNGKVVSPNGQPCRRCECVDGVISCRDPTCDCNQRGSHNDKCCPQCDPTAACHHQELRHVVFRSGERWIYQCQTCECLYGEIDCWPMECPPLLCSDPILAPGDCCPRCEDDPCSFDNTGNKTIGQPCMSTYTGRLFNSGTTTWQNPHDKCSACNCKDGRLCCSYDFQCAGSSKDKLALMQLTRGVTPFAYSEDGAGKVPDESSDFGVAGPLPSQAEVWEITTMDRLQEGSEESMQDTTFSSQEDSVSSNCGAETPCSVSSAMPKTPEIRNLSADVYSNSSYTKIDVSTESDNDSDSASKSETNSSLQVENSVNFTNNLARFGKRETIIGSVKETDMLVSQNESEIKDSND